MNQAEQWYEQLRNRPSLTEEDAASYKDILLDYMDEFRARGLSEEEAFKIASMRLEIDSEIEERCEMAGSAAPLIRRVLLVFSGILIFLFLYNVLQVYPESMCYFSYKINLSPSKVYQNTLYFTVFFHLIFLIAVLLVFKWKKPIFKRIQNTKIKPIHLFLLILFIFGLAFVYYQLRYQIRADVPHNYKNLTGIAEISLYSGYTFSLLAVLFFQNQLKKIIKSRNGKNLKNNQDDYYLKMNFHHLYLKLISEGWTEKEAIALVKIRHKISDSNQANYVESENISEKLSLLIFSGSLVYLFFYYLLNSTGKIFLTILQFLRKDPVRNLGWMEWYVYAFYLLIIFFTTSLYIKDMDLLDRLKRINLIKLRRIFFLTVILCVINCFFGAVSKKSLGNIYELKVMLSDIIIFSDLVFPIVLSLCFFVLFTKYYKENNS